MLRLLGYLTALAASPRAPLAGFVLSALLVAPVFYGYEYVHSAVRQPIAFNHAKHIENGLQCTDCHAGAQSEIHATLPGLDTCMNCHQAALTQSREEAKLRELAAAGKDVAWKPLTQMPPHVFFSHRRHVAVAKLACSECHGAMEKATTPPWRALRTITMDTCLSCHQQKGVDADCNDCHH